MKANLYCLKIPMKQQFAHSAKTRQFAESLVLAIEHNNIIGIGECAPRSYVTGETVDSVFESLQCINLSKILNGLEFKSLDDAMSFVKESDISNEKLLSQNMCCLIEMAVFDWLGKYFNSSLSDIIHIYYLNLQNNFSDKNKIKIKTSQVLDFSLTVDEFLKSRGPFHTVKIKASTDKKNNIDNVRSVREALGDDVCIIMDANMSWDIDTAQENIDLLSKFNVTYYEEPLPKNDWKGYQLLRKMTSAKIMLDESLCSLQDANSAVTHGAADAFNIRLAKCGGISKSIELINFAKTHGVDFQLGAQVAEVGPLIAASRHMAAVVSDYFTYEAGQPDRFFDEKYVVSPMPLVNRSTNLADTLDGDGLGISLTPNLYMYSYQQAYFKEGKWI